MDLDHDQYHYPDQDLDQDHYTDQELELHQGHEHIQGASSASPTHKTLELKVRDDGIRPHECTQTCLTIR